MERESTVYAMYPDEWANEGGASPDHEYLRCEECGRASFDVPNGPSCHHCGSKRLVLASEPPPVVDYRDGKTP